MKKNLLFVLIVLTLFSLTACKKQAPKVEETVPETEAEVEVEKHKAITPGTPIESIYRSKDEWMLRYQVPDYEENLELNEEEAKKIIEDNPELAAKCETGTFIGVKEDDVLMWKGVPYAKAPAGELRFKRAEALDKSNKYFEAYYFGKAAIQQEDPGEKASQYVQGDDCLNLNIWTSTNEAGRSPEFKDKKKPVFVYIHGGGWGFGGSSDPLYDGWNFAHYNPDTIVVTINYRVGAPGQINLSKLDPEGTPVASQSYPTSMVNGVLDQVAALKWLYENIEAFGGDKDNINVAGESAGGGSVSLLCTIPEARKYMKRALPMSGGANQAVTLKDTYTLQNNFFNEFNPKTPEDIAKITEEDMLEWWGQHETSLGLHHCVQDGNTIEVNPIGVWERGDTKELEILQGHTANEFAYYLLQFCNDEEFFGKFCQTQYNNLKASASEIGKERIKAYEDALIKLGYKEEDIAKEYMNDYSLAFINTYQAVVHANNGGKGYSYTFEQSYDGPVWSKVGAGHAIDCFYLFGNFDGNSTLGNEEEVELSRKYMKMINNFCLNGDPSIEGYEWPEYNDNTRYKMMFGPNLRVEENPEKERVDAILGMVRDADFFKPTTINSVIEQMAQEDLDAVIKFVIKNSEKEENIATLKNLFVGIEELYNNINETIGEMTEEQKLTLLGKIVAHVATSTSSEAQDIREAVDYFTEHGELSTFSEATIDAIGEAIGLNDDNTADAQ